MVCEPLYHDLQKWPAYALFFVPFCFCFLLSNFLYFGGVFNKTIIPLALVGYEMIIANEAGRLSIISYPTRAHGMIVNYNNLRYGLLLYIRLTMKNLIGREHLINSQQLVKLT